MHPNQISYGIWKKEKTEDWRVDLTEASIRSWCQTPDLRVSENLDEILQSSLTPLCLVQVPGHFIYLRSFFQNATRTLEREPKSWIAGDPTQAFVVDVEKWRERGSPNPLQEQQQRGIREFLFEPTPSRHWIAPGKDQRLDLLLTSRKRIVYFFNTDSLRCRDLPVSAGIRRAKITAPAAGLKAHFMAAQLAKRGVTESAISFYDISPVALEWQRLLHAHWDGRDYPRFIRENRETLGLPVIELPQGWQDRYEEKWNEFLSLFDSEDEWLSAWERYRASSPQFSCVDIIKNGEWQNLVSGADPEQLQVLDLSNIWTMYSCFIERTKEQVRREFQALLRGVSSRDPRIRVSGHDPDYRFRDYETVKLSI